TVLRQHKVTRGLEVIIQACEGLQVGIAGGVGIIAGSCGTRDVVLGEDEGQFTSAIVAGALTRLRLFLSKVWPALASQVGGVAPIPLFTRVLTSMLDRAL